MQSKEQAEDDELLEKFNDDADTKRKDSIDNSEIDDIADIEGADGENLKRNKTQIEGYDQDEDKASEISDNKIINVSTASLKGNN